MRVVHKTKMVTVVVTDRVTDTERMIYVRLGNTGYRVTMIPCDNDGNEIVE